MDQAEAIKATRGRMRITQQVLAARAKVSVRTVIRAEQGHPILDDNLVAICEVLSLDVAGIARLPTAVDRKVADAPVSPEPGKTDAHDRAAAALDTDDGNPPSSGPAADTEPLLALIGRRVRSAAMDLPPVIFARRVRGWAGRVPVGVGMACLAMSAAGFGEIHGHWREANAMSARDASATIMSRNVSNSLDARNPDDDDDDVVSWVKKTLPRVFAMDFVGYDREMDDLRPSFTVTGWREFIDANTRSGNRDMVKNHRYVSSGILREFTTVMAAGRVAGLRTWILRVPVDVSYQNTETSTTMEQYVTLTVVERDDGVHSLGIESLVEEARVP